MAKGTKILDEISKEIEKKNSIIKKSIKFEIKEGSSREDKLNEILELCKNHTNFSFVDVNCCNNFKNEKIKALNNKGVDITKDGYFLTLNVCEFPTKDRTNPQNKKMVWLTPDEVASIKFNDGKNKNRLQKFIDTLIQQLDDTLPNAYGWIQLEVKYDMRFGLFMPHCHLIILNSNEKELVQFCEKYYPKEESKKICKKFFKKQMKKNKSIRCIVKEYPQKLEIWKLERIENNDVLNYILKFSTYQTEYKIKTPGLKAEVVNNRKKKNYKDEFKISCSQPKPFILNSHLIFLSNLREKDVFISFHKNRLGANLKNKNIGNNNYNKIQKFVNLNYEKFVENKATNILISQSEEGFQCALSLYNFKSFKPKQKEAIEHILQNERSLLVLPTSFGKSFCYEIASLMTSGITIIIEPLTALANKHSDDLNVIFPDISQAKNYKRRCNNLMEQLKEGKIKFVHVAPETFCSNAFLDIIKNSEVNVETIVVEEAHCLEIYDYENVKGNSKKEFFRCKYGELHQFILNNFKDSKIVCVTGTATQKMIESISNKFNIQAKGLFIRDIRRNNLEYTVVKRKETGKTWLTRVCKKRYGKSVTIIFCLYKDTVEAVSNMLESSGMKCVRITGDNPDNTSDLIDAEKNKWIIVGTKAIGAGISIKNVKTVIHYEPSITPTEYLQETGRAGREGKKAKAFLFCKEAEFESIEKVFCSGNPKNEEAFSKIKEYFEKKDINVLYDLF